MKWLEQLEERLSGPPTLGKKVVAINIKPKSGPWGGGNQFVQLLTNYLRDHGHRVVFHLSPWVTHVLVIDPRKLENSRFGLEEIRQLKAAHPEVQVIHRINENDKRKNSAFMDELLREANQLADYTVFNSYWLAEYFKERWFSAARPHSVIQSGADDRVFFPGAGLAAGWPDECRVVTHHWSDNWMKGFKEYQDLDVLLARGELPGFSFTVIGRWPKEIEWKSTRLVGATRDAALARELRSHHLYLTASKWEPCGMHMIEGAQCGLPLVYHEDSGGTVEFGRKYGVAFRDDLKTALLQAREALPSLREQLIEHKPSGLRMCKAYLDLIEQASSAKPG